MNKTGNSAVKLKYWLSNNFSILGLVAMLIIGTLVNPSSFLTLKNFSNVLRQSVMVGLLCCGITFVIITGHINLSISAVYAFSAYVSMWCLDRNPALGIVAPLAVGALIGLICGVVILYMKVPAWIATLAIQLGVRGLLLTISNSLVYKPVNPIPAFYTNLTQGMVFGIFPVPIVICILVFAISAYVLNKTTLGRNFYAVGGNTEAARMMGINVDRTFVLVHTIAGLISGAAGIFLASRVGSAYPDSGTGQEMYAIASAALGGVRLSGGKGKMSGAFIGMLIMALITNVFNMQNTIDPNIEKVVTGSILIIVLVVQRLTDVATNKT